MNRWAFGGIFALGWGVLAWVAWGFGAANPLALVMTGVIAAVYGLGAHELRQFRAGTQGLLSAIKAAPLEPPAGLGPWLEQVPVPLQNTVRLRIEGERAALPAPALTPYLVGLLVMLGMLGTFVGMVVTFKGAVLALEGSADLQAIRTALSAPIKGLGLSFGTSVAGVAASAALGLLATISRRERQEAVRLLDRLTHTVFRAFSLVHQRQATYQAVQDQSQALPQVAAQLAALIEGLEQRHTQLGNQLLVQQTQFHQQVSVAYTGLAESVGAALQGSLVAGAKAAGDSLLPVVEAALRDMAQESGRVHQRQVEATQLQLQGLTEGWQTQVASLTAEVARLLGEFEVLTQKRVESEGWWRQEHQMHMDTLAQQLAGLGAALEAPMNRLMQTVAEVPRAATTVLAELRREAAQFNEQDVHTAEERLALVSQINALVVATQTVLEQANARFSAALEQHHAHTAEAATQVSAGAIELSSLGAAFEQGLQQFGATNHKLVDGLQRMELALQQSMARSDEQLAYYVAQAREVIDLSITSQQGIVQDLRRLRAQPTTAVETA